MPTNVLLLSPRKKMFTCGKKEALRDMMPLSLKATLLLLYMCYYIEMWICSKLQAAIYKMSSFKKV